MSDSNIERDVLAYLDGHQDEMFDCLSRLVQIDSINFINYGNERNCVEFLLRMYAELGLDAEVYYPDQVINSGHPGYLQGRDTDKRPNLAAVYHGAEGSRRIMLAAHTDTVPIGDADKWSVPPLGGIRKDGRIYGRGSSDNKFGLVSSYYALKAILGCGLRLKQDVVLSAYCDEEYGGGNGSIASCVKYPCEVYINLDGADSEVLVSSVGGQILSAEITAEEPQDSGELVIDGLNLLRGLLKQFQKNRHDELGKNKYYKGSDIHRSCYRIVSFLCGEKRTDLASGKLEFVFYAVAPKEQIYAELGEIERAAKSELKKMHLNFNGFAPVCRFFDYEYASEDDPAVRLMADCGTAVQGKKAAISGACLTDLFLYLRYGSRSSFNYGILRDFKLYGGAHQPDEYVECADFLNNAKALSLFLLRWCGCDR